MRKNLIHLILIGIFAFTLTGCIKNNNNLISNFYDRETGIRIDTNEPLPNDTIIKVDKNNDNYSELNEDIEKYIAYDISLVNEKNNIKSKIAKGIVVSVKIPNNFNKDNLVIYYVKDGIINETYNVIIDDEYAKFETTHFSIYVLAELKEKKKEEVNADSEVKEENIVKNDGNTVRKPEAKNTEESQKEEAPKCISKKFSNKYTYVYGTKEECLDKGYDAYDYVYDNINDKVTTFGCEQIIDDCGVSYFGVYFNVWVGPENDNNEKWYY